MFTKQLLWTTALAIVVIGPTTVPCAHTVTGSIAKTQHVHTTNRRTTYKTPVKWNISSTTHQPNKCQDDILLNDLYRNQKQPSHLYERLCQFQFLKLFKFNRSEEALLFGSIFNPDGHTTTADFKLLTQLAQILNIDIHYRLVIRLEKNYSGSVELAVKLNGITYPITMTKEEREYLIPAPLSESKLDLAPKLMIDQERHINISTSYVMFQKQDSQFERQLHYCDQGTQVQCYCTTFEKKGFVLPLVLLGLVWTVLGLVLACNCMPGKDEEPSKPEVQFNFVLCVPNCSTYEYLAIFRLGPATDGFDYESSFIDLQLLTTNDETVGNPLRFSASYLTDPTCAEMHMVICRITPLGTITGVHVNHSAPGSLLRLYNMTLINLRNDNAIVQEETFQQDISNEPTIMRPLTEAMAQMIKVPSVAQSQLPISMLRLSIEEKVALSAFVLGFTSVAVMMARVYLHCYEHWKDTAHSMAQFGKCFLAVTVFSWLLIALFEMMYVRCVKKPYLIELQQQVTLEEEAPYCCWLIRTFCIGALYVLSLTMCSLAIFLSKSLDIDSTGLWSGMNTSFFALSIGAWLVVDELAFSCIKSKRVTQEYAPLLSGMDGSGASTNFSSQSKSNAIQSQQSTMGPKFCNLKPVLRSMSDEQVESYCPAYSQFMKSHKSRKGKRHRHRHRKHKQKDVHPSTSQQKQSASSGSKQDTSMPHMKGPSQLPGQIAPHPGQSKSPLNLAMKQSNSRDIKQALPVTAVSKKATKQSGSKHKMSHRKKR